MKVLITVPDKFLEQVDNYAKINDYSRSQLVRHALKYFMNKLSTNKRVRYNKEARQLDKIL